MTPQTFSDVVGYCIAIAAAAFTAARRLTLIFIGTALALNVVAAIIDAARDGYNWELVGITTRVFSMGMILLVGILTLALQVRIENELLAEKLAERQEIIGDLVSTIAHDVRTPLAAISVTMEQAERGAFGELPPAYAGVLRDSRSSIDDLQHLAETLLLVARYEDTGGEAASQPVAIAPVIDELISEFGATAQARGITLRATIHERVSVTISRGDLRRALSNLLSNALSHTPRGGHVDMSLARKEAQADITVADDGFGVEPAFRERLFERGRRGDGVGTGLGLYIVRRIAEAAGGSASYEPQKERGSIFRLALPEVSDDASSHR
jgi:signal transduction histidine kinase